MNNDVYAVLQKYDANQINSLLANVENNMLQIERNFNYQDQYTQNAWQQEYSQLEYEREVLLAALNQCQQPMNRFSMNNGALNRFSQSRQVLNSNNDVSLSTRSTGNVTSQRGFGNNDGAVNRFQNSNSGFQRPAITQTQPQESVTTAPRTYINQNKGENMILKNTGINLLGSNIPFATVDNNVAVENGIIMFKVSKKSGIQIKDYKLDMNLELTANKFVSENGEDTLAMTNEDPKSFMELVSVIEKTLGCESQKASSLVLNVVCDILDKEMEQINIDSVLSKDSVFGQDEWELLDAYVNGTKTGNNVLAELKKFNDIVGGIYRHILMYVRANYLFLDGELSLNVFLANAEVDETYSFMNFINKYSNFRNFVLTDGVNANLHNIITSAYDKLANAFRFKKYKDYLNINLVIKDKLGYEYSLIVNKRFRTDSLGTTYFLKVCDMCECVN